MYCFKLHRSQVYAFTVKLTEEGERTVLYLQIFVCLPTNMKEAYYWPLQAIALDTTGRKDRKLELENRNMVRRVVEK